MELVERFLRYVSFDTQSSEENEAQCPSTEKQLALAEYLRDELQAIGLTEVELDKNGYVYATLPANTDKQVPTIGFIAHMDTSPDCSGRGLWQRATSLFEVRSKSTDENMPCVAGAVPVARVAKPASEVVGA